MSHEGMVHALTEAHRVLKRDGVLIDLRPAASHRRAGLGEGKQWKQVGAMRENFDDDLAAERAVKQVIRDGWFRLESLVKFDLDRLMDTLPDFRVWLDDFPGDRMPSHDWLYRRVERALAKKKAGTKIAVRGLMRLGVMRKSE
jgi:hypothetical protein